MGRSILERCRRFRSKLTQRRIRMHSNERARKPQRTEMKNPKVPAGWEIRYREALFRTKVFQKSELDRFIGWEAARNAETRIAIHPPRIIFGALGLSSIVLLAIFGLWPKAATYATELFFAESLRELLPGLFMMQAYGTP